MQFSISNKLKMGFGVVIVSILFSTVVNYFSLSNMQKSQSQVIQISYPAVVAGKDLINGVNQSLAALRGYMILGGEAESAEKFKQERKIAWQSINDSVSFMSQLSRHMDASSSQTLKSIKQILEQLKDAQQAIENISQTPENQPALSLLIKDAGPKANEMLDHLESMIEVEVELEANEERKTLLKYLSDSRGAFAVSVGGLRAYLITGDNVFKDQFDNNWQINTDAYLEIDDALDLLTDEQLVAWESYEALREQFAPISIEMFRLRSSDNWNVANFMLENEVEPEILSISKLLKKMALKQQISVDENITLLDDIFSFVYQIMLLAAVIVVFIGCVAGYSIAKTITHSMRMLVDHAGQISQGNLATDHSKDKLRISQDELGDLARNFGHMSESLSSMISTVKGHGIQMRIAAFQVGSLSEEILNGSQQEESRSGEVTDANTKLLASTRKNLVLASDALNVVERSKKQAQIGMDAVDATIAEMDCSVNEVKQTTLEIQALDVASQKIYTITDTIHQIADQTNLLALNAAIEAARAGEHGRGFAVVADEVRTLANKTSESTVEIANVVKSLKEKVEQSINAMNRASAHVFASQEKAAETASAINSINDCVNQITNSTVQISDSAQIQMSQLEILEEKLSHLFETLREDGSRAGAVSIIARVLQSVTENINLSLDKFVTLPIQQKQSIDNERRSEKRLSGCLRVEITQGESHYEGVTCNMGKLSLGIELSTKLSFEGQVKLTIHLPHKDFIEYKKQTPLIIKGVITREDIQNHVYQYGIKIREERHMEIDRLRKAFCFFEDIRNV
jgi:methyl-accepting chemotaxis protein